MTEPDEGIQAPSKSEVAAASRPRKAIMAEMKQREKEKAGKVYKPSKRDTAPYKSVNWFSPVFWPVIEMAARQQLGTPNHSKLVRQLQQQDPRFNHLSHQRFSEWRDLSVTDRFEWSPKTIAAIKKEFLPGGHQTRYNVFVSIFQ